MGRRSVPEQWQPVTKWLDAIVDLGFAPEVVFRDWVGIMFFRKMGKEKRCAPILEKYQGREMPGTKVEYAFLAAISEMLSCMSKSEGDGLNELYTAYASPSEPQEGALPFVLFQALAALQPDVTDERTVTMVRNCQSGGLMGALVERRSRERNERVKYVGQHKSLLCARMTALNLAWRGVEGLAMWADDQLDDIKGIWAIMRWNGLSIIHPVPTTDYAKLRKILSGGYEKG